MGTPWWQKLLNHGLSNGECHAWQPWAPHVSPSSLLKLHGLTSAGFITATGATGCSVCRGWVTAFGWFHHLGNKWMALFFAQDSWSFRGWRLQGHQLVPLLPLVAYRGQWRWAFLHHLSGSGLVGRLCTSARIATALFSHRVRSHSSRALWAKAVSVCGEALWAADVPNARMKGLSGSVGDGRCLIAATARKMSLALISYEGGVFFPMAGSESAHSCCSVYPGFGSIYLLFHTAWWDHWGASWLISTESRFMSYSFNISSSSCWVDVRWIQHCLTAPSMCSGHPTGMWESSRSPSPFCSIIVPSIGTSIVAFRLTCARLHFHVSGANRPLAASSSSDGILDERDSA